MIGILAKVIICEILVHVILSVLSNVKLTNMNNCSCEKRLIGKLVLECEDEILNTTETSLDDKKETYKKVMSYSYDFISNYMLVIISCCFYWLLSLLHKRLDKT